MTKTITKPALLKTLKELAEERPERINPECRYFFTNGAPLCLVGNALKRLAPDEFRLAKIKTLDLGTRFGGPIDPNSETINLLALKLPEIGIEITDDALKVATTVQMRADCDDTWAEAVAGV